MAKSRTELIADPNEDNSQLLKRKSVQIHGHSSSSSIESTHGIQFNTNGENSLINNPLPAKASSTTTDSDLESEQDDNLHSQPQKSDSSTSDQHSRRTKHFLKLFQSEIHGEMPELIDSYVCAYQGDILLQGKLYITDRYLCFHSRIINYVTKHVHRWEQIANVSKERVAFIFPTAIGIQLKGTGKRMSYASFLQRDQAFEKIVSICSRVNHMTPSMDDDDDDDDGSETAQDGTLKATNSNGRNRFDLRESYDVGERSEQEVLQLCLKDSQTGVSPDSRKNSDEKQSGRKSEKKSSTTKNLNHDQKLTNGDANAHSTTRQSRYTKNEQKSTDKTRSKISIISLRISSISFRIENASSVNHRSKSRHRTPSRTDPILSTSDPSPILPSPISNGNQTSASQISQNLSSFLPPYSIQTTIIIFLILLTLFLHSFYLIKLAYRIENRLQSLHHAWPSSSMKNSFSSNINEL